MSVKKWKQIITLSVIFIILILTLTSIISAVKYLSLSHKMQKEAEEYIKIPLNTLGDTYYRDMYPEMYVENDFICEDNSDKKICYLTFDDGPNESITPEVLDTLKKYDAKATFFVIYNDSDEAKELYKRIVEEGHTIAVHTASHDYTKIYSSVGQYLKDFEKMWSYIYEITGVKCELFRFPGGSVNSYNADIYQEITSEMLRRGFMYYDWNVSSGDASSSSVSARAIKNNVLKNGKDINNMIVLMHDGIGHASTAEALPSVLEELKNQGYEFRALTKDTQSVTFGYY